MDEDVIQAVINCDPVHLAKLLDGGANPNAQDTRGWSALRRAAANGCCAAADILLAHGASVESGGEMGIDVAPIVIAAFNGHIEVVQTLLAHGADVNRYSEKVRVLLIPTALTAAALRGHTSIVRLLLENGADTEKRNCKGQTALFSWHPNAVRLLLKHGADVNAKDEDGYTALSSALHELHHEEYFEGMQETVNLLQEASDVAPSRSMPQAGR